jgi:hypothetical protein
MGLMDGFQGLLGTSMEDPRTMATLQLAQGLLGGGGSMQRLAGGLQGYGGVMAQSRQQEEQRKAEALKRQLLEAQIGETKAQAQQRQAEALRFQQQAAEQQRIQSLLAGAVQSVKPGDAIAASGVRGPRPEALLAIGQQAPIDYRALIAAGVPIDRVKALAESQDYGRPEVARTMKGMVNGREQEQQFDRFGRPVGQGLEQYRAPIQADTGGAVNFLDPYNLRSIAQLGKTQTPDGKASNAVAWANVGLGRDRLELDRSNAAPGRLTATQERVQVDRDKAGRNSEQMMSAITEAKSLLGSSPTESGIGAGVDWLGRQFGGSTDGAKVAAKLETLSGWMVANVPRMEGPQSNFDVENYKTMAAMVGDRTRPVSERLAALSTLEKLQRKYAEINGTPLPDAPPTGVNSSAGVPSIDLGGGFRVK